MGDLLRQPDLAASLESISKYGPDAFYTRRTADLIVKAIAAEGGILAKANLEQYARMNESRSSATIWATTSSLRGRRVRAA